MKVVKLKGGLGNQMFQYAYAKVLQKTTKEEIFLDYTAFDSLDNDNVRVPRIKKFCITLPSASNEQIDRICKIKHRGNSQALLYRVGILVEKKINKEYFFEPNRAYIAPERVINYKYYDGYWQSWRYVEEVRSEIEKEYVPNYTLSNQTRETQKKLKNENSVFVGVRRGDYTKEVQHYGYFGTQYYRTAMEYISEQIDNPQFYVFSNDIAWCKQNIDWSNYNVKFREQEEQVDDFEELILMNSCKHAIIVNSSYHWWGAYLNSDSEKIVCCPEKWWFDDKPIDIIPEKWIRIKNEI